MHNPLRSESDAFRLVLFIGAGAAAVIALALITGPPYGGALAAGLLGLGAGFALRGARGTLPHDVAVARAEAGDPTYRILVVANETVGGRTLLEEIRNRAKRRSVEILVVTPALTRSQLQHWVSDVDEAIAEAERRREESIRAMAAAGLEARGEVGDSDPNVAIEDALTRFPADELIVSTHPPQRSRWLERGVVERARRDIDLPITHVVVDLEAERAAA